MIKIFIYNGSNRNNKSMSKQFIDKFMKNLIERDIEVQSYYYDQCNSLILPCIGCLNCFESGVCNLKDDFNTIKEKMFESDIIILASPVFVHNVSGQFKTFIDRLAGLTHTMSLAGKFGIVISSTETTGNDYVNSYINKICNYLGIVVLQTISLHLNITQEGIENYIDELEISIEKALLGRYRINREQEIIFQENKNRFHKMIQRTYESKVWENYEMSSFQTFKEAFCAKCKINTLGIKTQ